MKSWRHAALNANKTRWHLPSFMAEGSREVTNRATSEFRSISVTKETLGTFWAADLNASRKFHVEFGLGYDAHQDTRGTDMRRTYFR